MRLTHISLFAGIGGDALAAEWAGFEHVLFCEINPYCQQVLKKHWPNVPLIGDVRDVTRETVMAYTDAERHASIMGAAHEQRHWSTEVADSQPGRGGVDGATVLDLITGGFPCQPHSVAGKRKGSSDKRDLWPELRPLPVPA